ncbi:unnamed protein product [Rhizopus stolonifer]
MAEACKRVRQSVGTVDFHHIFSWHKIPRQQSENCEWEEEYEQNLQARTYQFYKYSQLVYSLDQMERTAMVKKRHHYWYPVYHERKIGREAPTKYGTILTSSVIISEHTKCGIICCVSCFKWNMKLD